MQRNHLVSFQLRAPAPLFDAIDGWRRQQDKIPNAAEAVRQLIAKGLAADAAKASRSETKAA